MVELDWPITSPVTVVDGQILLGGADGMLRALNPKGEELWRVQLWRPVELGPVALDDGTLAIGGTATCTGTARETDPRPRPRPRLGVSLPAGVRAQETDTAPTDRGPTDTGPLIRYGKWVLPRARSP